MLFFRRVENPVGQHFLFESRSRAGDAVSESAGRIHEKSPRGSRYTGFWGVLSGFLLDHGIGRHVRNGASKIRFDSDHLFQPAAVGATHERDRNDV